MPQYYMGYSLMLLEEMKKGDFDLLYGISCSFLQCQRSTWRFIYNKGKGRYMYSQCNLLYEVLY
jgi:hypothetical protein